MNTSPAKAGGFEIWLKAALVGRPADYPLTDSLFHSSWMPGYPDNCPRSLQVSSYLAVSSCLCALLVVNVLAGLDQAYQGYVQPLPELADHVQGKRALSVEHF